MKVIGLGEILWRISTPNHLLFSQANQLESQFGGSELNVLGTLSHLGYETEMVSVLPDNTIGHACRHFISSHHIGDHFLKSGGHRLGLYFYERGFSVRQSQITYDRAGSAFSACDGDSFDWDLIFRDADWFHVSGITVALNPSCRNLTLQAMDKAKEYGVGISFDLNYRESLWTSFEEAREGMAPFVERADICIGIEPLSLPNEDGVDLKDVLKLERPYRDKESLLQALKALSDRYHLEKIAFTQRELDNNLYRLKGYLFTDGQLFETLDRETQAVDRIGTGDAFTAGILYGHLEAEEPQKVLEIAMTSFVYKHTIEGDINLMTANQLKQLLSSSNQEINR
ncbi:sugar kinase [Streptococcus merionis]|uniref:Ribokinase family sugar kinase n=1 Tax=Streptococcus merionis TaxID=400065 RepID=A0A239SP15_9STRE|nr:sugar kinase [Streptococcus merionis]SNU86618.1 ribokinase family sugar kinase [Streptococcus merionis]